MIAIASIFIAAIVWFVGPVVPSTSPAEQTEIGDRNYVYKEYGKAFIWYQKAADHGYAAAQTKLGWLYEAGLGVKQDYPTAMAWYERAADQGFAAAQLAIGRFYESGWGVSADSRQAKQWYEKADAQGYVGATAALDRVQASIAYKANKPEVAPIVQKSPRGEPGEAARSAGPMIVNSKYRARSSGGQ